MLSKLTSRMAARARASTRVGGVTIRAAAVAAASAARRTYWVPPANHHVPALTNAHPHSKHLPAAYMMSSPVVVERASGSFVFDRSGKQYLDFQSGIGVTSLGHCHPAVVKATTNQISKLIHGQMNCFQHLPMLELTEKLTQHTSKVFSPERGVVQYHFSNSGAEGVENAVKLARQATGKGNIIVFQGGFHGRTLGTGALTTAKTFYRQHNNPLPGGTFVAQYPYCVRCPIACACASAGATEAFGHNNCCGNPITSIKYLLKQQTAPTETAAVLIEPVLGEGGYVVPPPAFFKELRQLCDENGLLLIVDEVQSGFGRTGKLFAIEHWRVEPDIIVMAKGIASGFPLSGIAAPQSVFARTHSGSVGGTYGGNAVACAAANAVLDTFAKDNVLANVQARSKQWFNRMNAISAKYPGLVLDVRGLGLMTAVEFNTSANGKFKPGTAGKVQSACLNQGLLILTTGIYDTLRFIPPLTVSEKEMDQAMDIVDKACGEVFKAAN